MEKLSSKSLMIGDWVYRLIINGQEPIQIKYGYQIEECEDLGYAPIPLTCEILKKNGFSENYREYDLSYAQSWGDIIGIHIFGKGGIMDEMYFKYVHELQHALHLCGIEKEIVL
jgi:hypothetical protein